MVVIKAARVVTITEIPWLGNEKFVHQNMI
jgi:hypothetical protein